MIDNTINSTGNGSAFITKYPIAVYSMDPRDDISADIIPLGTGLGVALPLDTHVYQLSFSAELRVNTYNPGAPLLPTPDGFIDYLQEMVVPSIPQSLNPPAPQAPAVIQLQANFITNHGIVVDTSPSTTLGFSWVNMCTSGAGTPPANFTVKQNHNHPGQPGTYYVSCETHQNPAINLTYPPSALDHRGKPLGRRVITFACTQGFSFETATVRVRRLNH